MMKSLLTRASFTVLSLLILLSLTNFAPTAAEEQVDYHAYLPTITKPAEPVEPLVEFRGIWVSRFDWTTLGGADPAKIDEIIDNVSTTGFNAIFFQVRGEASAFYTPA